MGDSKTGSSSSLVTPAVVGAGAELSGVSSGAAHGHAHARVLDRHLLHARLLDDADDLADALGAAGLLAARLVVVAAAAAADRVEQRLGVLTEQREQAELLVARGQPVRHLPGSGDVDRLLLGRLAADELHRALRQSGRSRPAASRSGRR